MRKINSFFKKFLIIISIIIFASSFSASYTSLNIDNLVFAVAMGIDKGESNKLKVTFEFIAQNPSSEGASESEPILDSVECSSITNGINMMNSYLGRKVNLAHCKLIVFSEELAKDGISDEVYSLINEVQVRPSANIVVSKCTAKYYIENLTPSLENLIPKFYSTLPKTGQYTGYTADATIGDFFNSLVCNACNPYAILGGITSSNENFEATNDSKIKANQTQIEGTRDSEYVGLAVFRDTQLVGELNAIETVCFLNLKNKVENFLVTIPDPQRSDSSIDIYLEPDNTNKIKVKIVNGSPYIKIDLNFSGKIYSMSRDSEYLDPEVLESISTSCQNYLKQQFLDYLYKTSTVYHTDINAFGIYAYSQFTTITEFNNYNWLENYKNSNFDVNINIVMDSGFLLTQT